MARPDFVHLHVHSEYSLLDGANRIPKLVEACKADGQGALALTDHGNMFGAVELYKTCKAGGIKPLIGCEVYIADRSMHEGHNKRKGNGYSHLTLLARNKEGYQNLLKLASAAYLEGLHTRPRIDWELLDQHAAGINCLSGCLGGRINQLFLRGKESEAEQLASHLSDLFGRDHFWLELQRNGIDDQNTVNEALVRLKDRLRIPLVATNDIHYLRHEDCVAQDILLCINTGAKRDDKERFRFDTDSLFFRSREEMGHLFRDVPESVTATMDVADQVDVELELGKYHVPEFETGTDESAEALFDRLLEERLEAVYGNTHQAARERLEHEKKVIRDLGFVSYFLIVWDLVRWAREHDIPVGPGRGSAVGSIVSYLLDITRLDPLKYGLLFERFLNSSRVSMPDIDIDFCKEGRERVIQYTRDKYGQDNVTQIVTFGTMASRTVVRDVARVLDIPLRDVDRVAKKIPAGPGAPPLREAVENDPDLRAQRDSDALWTDLFKYSVELEGSVRHASTHAAGVVITPRPTVEFVPLAKIKDDITTQYAAPELEELGLLKMDYLGLRTLTIISRCLGNIRAMGGAAPDIENLPAGDEATYKLLVAGDTLGVFQLESEGMRKLLARLKPDCFEDLMVVLALYRPGPLESGMVDMFCDRKHGKEAITYPHESLEEILAGTYGCIVYQEQVMLASVALGGFSLNDADNLRKAMGKKKPEIMQEFSSQFVEGAVAAGCDRRAAEDTWETIVKFGGYGFNKSHSAAYAMITYQTAFLKANFRTAFMAANLSCEMGDSDKVKSLIDDCQRVSIEITPPDMSRSLWEFSPEGAETIRFGLGAIKGVGSKAVVAMVEGRNNWEQQNPDSPSSEMGLHELCSMVDPTAAGKIAWEAVIRAGAFDFTEFNRGAIAAALEGALSEAAGAAADRRSGQMSMLDVFGDPQENASDSDRQSCIDPSRSWNRHDTLAAEFEILGFYLSGHPLEERAGLVSLLSTCPTVNLGRYDDGSMVMLAGLVLQAAIVTIRNGRMAGKKMARFRLEDLKGSVAVTAFPKTLEKYKDLVVDGATVLAKAKIETRGDEPSLILEELIPIEDALTRFQGSLQISLGPEDSGLLDRLRSCLGSHSGAIPVQFQVQGNDGSLRRVKLPRESAVALDQDLVLGLQEILGHERLALVKT
ncbi:MAG TPA: DNA polymerase III subunit alpha [Planctomycetes bacterium]|nr:DNA polymerase III subunit alpha [Planctomycetota bacterium]HIK60902.1 DNA polymerase III subunit alpha [Planctomycetota bacterium]